jgi:hypothetical protein
MVGVGTLAVLAVLVLEDDGCRQQFSIAAPNGLARNHLQMVAKCAQTLPRSQSAWPP